MNIGYIRVSAKDQNPDRQLIKMRQLGIEDRFIFIDKRSGKNFDRPEYQAMRKIIREGDLVYIDALDRLGRNYDQIIEEWKFITRTLNADIIILENETLFDSRKFKSMGDIGKLLEDQFLSLLSYVAEQERNKIRRRQAEGIAAAKEKGIKVGRPKISYPDGWEKIFSQWDEGKVTGVEAAKRLGLKKGVFYSLAKQYDPGWKERKKARLAENNSK
jgi:DNA invertase Pin-like site-specific DNA recombinase